MGVLDVFIVNVANPAIQAELNATFGDIQLVVAGYTLAYAVGLVAGGRLGDALGRRRVFILGTVLFGITSVACAAAGTPEVLIGARILQGLGAALMLPQVLALIQVTFPRPDERARALGLYGAAIGLGVVAGQLVGGTLIRLDVAGLGWRSIFVVNVPLCVLALVGAVLTVNESRGDARVRLDLVGTGLLAAGLVFLLHPLVIGGEQGWSWWTAGEFAASVALLGAFVRWERRVTRRGGAALLPPRLFTQPGFAKGVPAVLFFHGANGSFVFMLAYYLQDGLGFSPFESGLEFTPMAVLTAAASLACGGLVARLGHRIVPAGAVIMIAGVLLAWGAVAAAAPDSQALALLPGLALYGLGGGLVAPSLLRLGMAGVHPEDAGAASGSLLTAMQTAQAVGVAGLGTVFTVLVGRAGYGPAFGISLLVLCALFSATFVFLVLLRPKGQS